MKRKSLFIGLLLLFIVFIPGRVFAEEDYLNYDFKTPLNADGTVNLYVDKEFEHFIVAGNGKMDPRPEFGVKIDEFFYGLSESEKDALKTRMDDIYENGFVLEIKSGVQFPDDSKDLFTYMIYYIKEIKFPKDLDTSNVTDMSLMFFGQKKLKTPDVSNWNTSNVTNMSEMFNRAEIANPDVSKWDTSNVTDMSFMFVYAKNSNPDVSNWNMSKVEDISNMFFESGIIELDLRKWALPSNFEMEYSSFRLHPKVQYFYLSEKSPLIGKYYDSTYGVSSFKKQKDNNPREDVLSRVPGESFEFENTGADTVYFIPQKTSLNVLWKDNEKRFRPDKQKVEFLANGGKIKSPMTIPPEANPVELNDSNSWHHGYSDLDIFNGGKKIDYTVKAEDIDDYITDYVFKKEGTVLYSSQKGEIKDQKDGFTIINTYMTIAEEKPFGVKPRVPKNFVKVTVDTTDKATSDTKFKRAFWVTPNLELELPVGEPTGKSGQANKYTFEGWKGLEPSTLKWNKGEKIKAKFTSETTIEAQYKDESQQKPPAVDPKDKEDNPQEPPANRERDRRTGPGSFVFTGNTPLEKKPAESKEEGHLAYIKGYPDDTVRTEGKVTRAEAVTMVVRLKAYPLIEGQGIYKDVGQDKWYAPYIEAAYRQGILEEKEGENFRPDEKITRGELAQIISHIDKKNDAKAPFTDIEGYKFRKAIDQSYGNKRIIGYPDNTFRPNGEITRAETVAMLNRLFERHVRQGGLKDIVIKEFKDLKDKTYWAYYDIVEASNDHIYTRVHENSLEEVWKAIIK